MVKFVRLACLMCAASVYPEPGSNSLVFGIHIYFRSYKSSSSFLTHFLIFFFGSTILPLLVFSKVYCLLFNVLFCSLRTSLIVP